MVALLPHEQTLGIPSFHSLGEIARGATKNGRNQNARIVDHVLRLKCSLGGTSVSRADVDDHSVAGTRLDLFHSCVICGDCGFVAIEWNVLAVRTWDDVQRRRVLEVEDHFEQFSMVMLTRTFVIEEVTEGTSEEILVPLLGAIDRDVAQPNGADFRSQQCTHDISHGLIARDEMVQGLEYGEPVKASQVTRRWCRASVPHQVDMSQNGLSCLDDVLR